MKTLDQIIREYLHEEAEMAAIVDRALKRVRPGYPGRSPVATPSYFKGPGIVSRPSLTQAGDQPEP